MTTISCSKYLKDQVDQFKELVNALNAYFDDASILGVDSTGKNYNMNKSDMSISEHAQKERGYVCRCLKDGRYYEYSFNQFTSVQDLCEEIVASYKEDLAFLKAEEIENYDCLKADETNICQEMTMEVEKTNEDVSDKEVLDILAKKRDELLSLDNRIVNIDLGLSVAHISKIFISKTRTLVQGYMYSETKAAVTMFNGQKMKSGRGGSAGKCGYELLSTLDDVCKTAFDETIALLDSTPLVPGFYDVVVSPSVAGVIAHEAFGHGVEMDMFVKNRALAASYIQKTVGSDVTFMLDGAKDVDHVGSYLFDDEGNLGTKTYLIQNGILNTGISDDSSAKRLGTAPTGNGRRDSFERKAYARMTNTYFDSGKDKLEDMIASISDGYLLEGLAGGMEDPKHWGMTVTCSLAREVKDGKLTGKVHSPVLITGYVPDLLGSISMVSSDMDRNTGMCGKGYKEWVKVSCGGPYLKMKVRLG